MWGVTTRGENLPNELWWVSDQGEKANLDYPQEESGSGHHSQTLSWVGSWFLFCFVSPRQGFFM